MTYGISQVSAGTRLGVDSLWLNDRRQPDSIRVRRYGQAVKMAYTYTDWAARQNLTITGGPGGFLARQFWYHPSTKLLSDVWFGGDRTMIRRNNDLLADTIILPGTGHTIDQDFTGVHSLESQESVGLGNLLYHVNMARRIDQRIDASAQKPQHFGYDNLGRLTSTTFWSGMSCGQSPYVYYGYQCVGTFLDSTHTFSYDQIGNRTDHSATYVGNRLTSFDGCTYAYDNDGNATSRTCAGQTVTFIWDALNRMTRMTVNGTHTDFRYDAFGRLARQWGGSSQDRNFLWDGDNLAVALNGNMTARMEEYSYYPGLDRLHAVFASSNSTTHFAHTDGLGNVAALTNVTKSVVRTYKYDEWGKLVGGVDNGINGANRARFKGALHLGPTNAEFYYMRTRWYEPKTGRFLSEDPIGLEGGINLYAYAEGDPVNGRDPTGLKVCFDLTQGKEKVDSLRTALENATNTDIELDEEGCIKTATARDSNGAYARLQAILRDLIGSSRVIGVRFGTEDDYGEYWGSNFDPRTNTAVIFSDQVGRDWYMTGNRFTCAMTGGGPGPGESTHFTLPGLLVHELLGHGGGVARTGRPASHKEAIRVENRYYAAVGSPRRC